MDPSRLTWLRSKVIKDGSDIIALLDPANRRAALNDKMDYGQLKALTSEFDITNLVDETIRNALQDRSVLSLYGRKVNARSILKQIAN